jgi:hypothetical protein
MENSALKTLRVSHSPYYNEQNKNQTISLAPIDIHIAVDRARARSIRQSEKMSMKEMLSRAPVE